jgi:hypothetical protein
MSLNNNVRSPHDTCRTSVPGHEPIDSGLTQLVSTVSGPMIDDTYAMTPSGSAPKAAAPRPLFRNTSSAPGDSVVVVVDVLDVVDVVDVLVEVDAAVVTGVVVVVTSVSADVELAVPGNDDVDPESVVVALSLPHAAIVSTMRASGAMCIDFTVGSLARFVAIT